LPCARRQLSLVRQKGRPLREEDRQRRQSNLSHLILPVLATPLVRQIRADLPQFQQQAMAPASMKCLLAIISHYARQPLVLFVRSHFAASNSRLLLK
jgi:hypothetical protein